MMTWKTACQTLDLPIDRGLESVKPAYLKAVRNTHPDQTGTQATEGAFIKVVEAHERLTKHRTVTDQTEQKGKSKSDSTLTPEEEAAKWLFGISDVLNETFKLPRECLRFIRCDIGDTAYFKLISDWRNPFLERAMVIAFSFKVIETPTHYATLVNMLGEPVWINAT